MTQRFRLFPIVIVTAFTVLGLKTAEIVRQGEISFGSISVARAQEKPADKKADAKPEKAMEKTAEADKDGKKPDQGEETKSAEVPAEQSVTSLSQSEIALLEALSKRRKELEKLEKELDLQKNLLKAAEKRIDDKIAKLEKIRDGIAVATAKQKKLQNGKFKKLVSIFEGMKPKESARILSNLDSRILLQVAERIAPRKMSAIMAKMEAKAAERLTVQLAIKAAGEDEEPGELPAIGGGESG